ncbi:TauD/TfdA family dioxygenase [Onishia niordana]|uniref:TauD/TfdA family dioxygenase n=1 Tax=Onishia niordana TaxID=2508711 RepID=UPI001F0DA345|nr:TauD/TfdA family dioxygenase [Halomonas niordiana]
MNATTLSAPDTRPVIAMGELSAYSDAPALTDVLASGARATLSWADGAQAHFPLMWLRDNCACVACRHAITRERLYVPLAPITTAPEAKLHDGNLILNWQDGHVSTFDAGWLHQRRPGQEPAPVIPARRPWATDFAPTHVSHADFVGSASGERAWLTALLRDGLVLMDGGPLADEEVSRLAERIGPMRPTNFGARFDVRSKPNPNNAAYTAMGLALHTDLPNWRQPPDIQLLYCLENDAEGGESIFADGFAAADTLRQQDPEAFRILSETPIDFRFQDEEQDITTRAPVLSVDHDDQLIEVRFNNWIRDSLRLPTHAIDAWYAAYRRFWELLHSSQHQLDFALAPGQMIAFDNRRVLHGRRAFDPSTGRRHLQGTYLDLDMIESRLRVLSRPD